VVEVFTSAASWRRLSAATPRSKTDVKGRGHLTVDRFDIKETDVPADDTAGKPVPVTVGRPLRAVCR
jgi:hypothetical protein